VADKAIIDIDLKIKAGAAELSRPEACVECWRASLPGGREGCGYNCYSLKE